MKNARLLCVLGSLATAIGAHAVLAPIAPFASPRVENFDAIAPGAYPGGAIMGGFATAVRLPAAGAFMVGMPALPAWSGPNALYGNGCNLAVNLSANRNAFGGYFRVPAGSPVTGMKFVFKNSAGVVVGNINRPIGAGGWVWWGFNSTLAFRRVELYGNGPIAGFVGMDDIVVN